MIPRRVGTIDLSSLESCVKDYLAFNSSVVERRQHFTLLKALNFLREELGVKSYGEILKAETRQIILALQRFINRCVDEGQTAKSIRFKLYLVRDFLSFYDVEISPKKLKVPRKSGHARIDRIPSIGDLQKLLLGTRSKRLRLAILMMTQTGLRPGECLSIRREWVDLDRGFIVLPPEATKIGRAREVPITGELRRELNNYLQDYPYRRGYLFCVEGNPEKKIPMQRFREEYRKLLKRLGLDERTPDEKAYRLHPHVFRKWYRTMLESAGVNKLLIDLWMGHNSGVEKHYYLPTPEMVKAEVEKADKALRIFGQAYAPMSSEKAEALEEAVTFYEKLIEHINRKNPRLLRELGLE